MPNQDPPQVAPAAGPSSTGRHLMAFPHAMTRALAILVGLALISLIAWYGWLRPTEVTVVSPWHGSAIEAVYATGVVEAVDTTRIASTVPGRIVSLTADEGDTVVNGQMLAQIDDRQARHRMDDALARLAHAEGELSRARELLARQVRTRQDLERAQEEFDQATAAVRLFVRQVEDHRIASPMDGVVNRRLVEPGETVSAHQTMFELLSPGRLRIAADVDERDIPGIRIGAEMAVGTDAFPKEAFAVHVTAMRKAGDSVTRTFRVEADLPQDTKLRIGMTVDANIVINRRVDALLVPASAVQHDPPKGGQVGEAFVLAVRDRRAVRIPIVAGAVGLGTVEVRSGLAASDIIIRESDGPVRGGERVRVTDWSGDRK